MDDVLAVAGGPAARPGRVVGRAHIAEALRRKGFVHSKTEAFQRYIAHDGPAYVDKERFTSRQVLATIHDADGVAVLAHPVQLGCGNSAQVRRVLQELVLAGLDGIEVYHTDHTPAQIRLYLDLARRLRLGVTGGSDFHGSAKPESCLGRPRVPLSCLDGDFAERLFARS